MTYQRNDFFSAYLSYTQGTEVPPIFHRWSAIAGIGAYLGRNCWIKFGHARIYPNMYCMLMGNPGTRKSTAIKIMKGLLLKAGYTTIAASKTTKEKFLLDLSGIEKESTEAEDLLDKNLFGGSDATPAESFIMADEFNDFFGNNNLEFISLLGSLWDWEGPYENRIKNGKSFVISNPTISILGGNTPTGFSIAFPTEILGQGFFSRILLIYGEPTGIKIAFPEAKSDEETTLLIRFLQTIRSRVHGEMTVEPEAKALLEKIYTKWTGLPDVRFESYSNRRFTHLLKLCAIHAAADLSTSIRLSDVVYANTILSHTEHFMPKALGEFGKAKHSDVSHKIISLLESATRVLTVKEIWKHVSNDLEKMKDLGDLLSNLTAAEKIQTVSGGFLIRRTQVKEEFNGSIDYNYLTTEERRFV